MSVSRFGCYSSFFFLAYPPPTPIRPPRSARRMARLRSQAGALELVADFLGVLHGRELRNVRELAEVLEVLLEAQLVDEENGSDSSDRDSDGHASMGDY